MIPLSLIEIRNFILLLYGIIILVISICIFVKPKLWNIGIGIGLIILVMISILNQLLFAFIDTSFLFARVDRDADGYTRCAAYITNRRDNLPDRDFYPNPTSYTSPSIAFSPDGLTIVCGNKDGTITLWSKSDKSIVKSFPAHEETVNSIAFSPNGEYIVSGGQDGLIRLWNGHGFAVVEPFGTHGGAVNSVAFSPNSEYIASGGNDGTIRLWNCKGSPIGEPFLGHKSSVTTVAFHPDGNSIASGSPDNTVRMWDLNGKAIGQPLEGLNFVTSVTFSPDGKYIAGAGEKGFYAMLWDCQGNPIAQMHIFLVKRQTIAFLAFSPDGKTIVTTNRNGDLHLWDLNGNLIGNEISGNGRAITSIAFSPDGQTIASASSDNHIYLWNINGELEGRLLNSSQEGEKKWSILPHYYRSLGYPIILSMFMHLTGQYNSVAAAICHPIILSVLVVLGIIYVWRKFGLLYAVALSVPFLDPTNDLIRVSIYDQSDFVFAIIAHITILLLYKVVLSKKDFKYYFLIWFIVAFVAASIKMVIGIIMLLACFSIIVVICIGKFCRLERFKEYKVAVVSKRLVPIIISVFVISMIHMRLAPGATIFNRQAGLIMCYLIPAPNNGDPLLSKIGKMQELASERRGSIKKEYSGAGLTHPSSYIFPAIYQDLPFLRARPAPFIDPKTGQFLELSPEEAERGAVSLFKSNPFPLVSIAIKHGLKDYKNILLFGEKSRKHSRYGTVYIIFLLVGIYTLYKYNSMLTTSVYMTYFLFYGFLCMAAAPSIRYLLPFLGFYYAAIVFGTVTTLVTVQRILIRLRE